MPVRQLRRDIVAKVRRVVVKVGTNALTGPAGRLDAGVVGELSRQIAGMLRAGLDVTLVSSGAIGAGMAELDLPARPATLPMLQATAAVGQGQLMRTFHDAFGRYGVKVAQILITRDDFQDRTRYLNIRNTIAALADCHALPIINENDTVSVDEIRYGDNDIIAALVTNNLRSDLLVLLTVVEGLCRDAARGDVVDVVERIDKDIERLVDGTRSARGSGGMASKLEAVRMVTRAGEAAVIANGRREDVLGDLLDGRRVGTLFLPTPSKMTSRKRWIAFTVRARGRLTVDDGAARALCEKGKSLLASGIVGASGSFKAGDLLVIVDERGGEIARGLTNYDADALAKIRGRKSSEFKKILGEKPYDEVIHRDNLVLRR